MPDQHALLSASGAHRWLECPPSATLEAGLPEYSSQAAEQGTAAHALAEWKLRRALHDAPTAKPVSSWHDEQMDVLTDDYVVFVQERLRDVRQACADPQVLIEQRLDFSHVVPGGFGTGDCVIIAEPTLQIIDLKYGQGHGRGRREPAAHVVCARCARGLWVALRHHRGGGDDLPAQALERLDVDDPGV